LPIDPGSDPIAELPEEHSSGSGSNTPAGEGSGSATPWAGNDRRRLILWALISFIPPFFVLMLLRRLGLGGDPGVLAVPTELPIKAASVVFVVLATWIVARLEKRPFAAYGMPPRQAFGVRFWEGLIWGFAILSAVVLVLAPSGHFRIDSAALAGKAAVWSGLAWGVTFLAVSWHEEFAFRGYWLFFMARRMRFWPAALFLSAVFGAAHLGNHGENVIGILHVVGTGLLFCLMIRCTGNLWFAAGYHAAWDWAETFFYGTPDSGLLGVGRFLNSSVRGPDWLTGGSAGPEGSVISIAGLLVCAALIHWRFPTVVYPDRPE